MKHWSTVTIREEYTYIYIGSLQVDFHVEQLNTLKQSRINIMRGKNDATTFPDKPVS